MKLLHMAAALLVGAVSSVDGLLVTGVLLGLLGVGGFINSIWPTSWMWLVLIAFGALAVAVFVAFVVIPLIADYEDTQED